MHSHIRWSNILRNHKSAKTCQIYSSEKKTRLQRTHSRKKCRRLTHWRKRRNSPEQDAQTLTHCALWTARAPAYLSRDDGTKNRIAYIPATFHSMRPIHEPLCFFGYHFRHGVFSRVVASRFVSKQGSVRTDKIAELVVLEWNHMIGLFAKGCMMSKKEMINGFSWAQGVASYK